MTISKKGARLISVNNVKYRWLIRRKPTYNQTDYGIGFLHVAIELAKNPKNTLIIYTNHQHPYD